MVNRETRKKRYLFAVEYRSRWRAGLWAIVFLWGWALPSSGQQTPPIVTEPRSSTVGYENTPLLPGQQWRVHDSTRPHPRKVKPGISYATDTLGAPPSDAIVLFDGKELLRWWSPCENVLGTQQCLAAWPVRNGYVEDERKGVPSLITKEKFGSCQLHIEWATPVQSARQGQARGNGNLFLMSRYEVQILDSYENLTYADGQAAAIYAQWPPLVNASRQPGDWQSFDLFFEAPSFANGRLVRAAAVTVLHNGVLVHHRKKFLGATLHAKVARYTPHEAEAPLMLQTKGFGVRYRNIWIRRLRGYDESDISSGAWSAH